MFSIIAAVGKNRELGKAGQLVFRIREDMQFFKKTTMGHPVLMGRKTYESIGRALPGRQNFVATRHPEFLPEGVEPVRELRQFIEAWLESETEIFAIGGAEIYKAVLPYAQTIYLTEVEAETEADTFFPEFDKTKYEKIILGKGEENGLKYTFAKYTVK